MAKLKIRFDEDARELAKKYKDGDVIEATSYVQPLKEGKGKKWLKGKQKGKDEASLVKVRELAHEVARLRMIEGYETWQEYYEAIEGGIEKPVKYKIDGKVQEIR